MSNALSCPSIGIDAVSHLSSVILAPCLVVPVLGLLRQHAQWSQNWNDYGVISPQHGEFVNVNLLLARPTTPR